MAAPRMPGRFTEHGAWEYCRSGGCACPAAWRYPDPARISADSGSVRGMHKGCVLTALTGAGLTRAEAEAKAAEIAAIVDKGECPRCCGALTEHPAQSRTIPDECVPVCPECGKSEAIIEFQRGGRVETLADWPLDASEVRAHSHRSVQ